MFANLRYENLTSNLIFDKDSKFNRDDSFDPYIQLKKSLEIKKIYLNTPDVNFGKNIDFVENKICRVLNVDDEGATFSVQYTFETIEEIEAYQKNHAPRLQADHSKRYEGKYAAFRTVLEIL